jgi:DNA polymerase (family 10)
MTLITDFTKKLKFSQKPMIALNQLVKYAQNGKIRTIPSLGQKSEQSILKNTLVFLGQHQRLTFKEANKISQDIINYMKQVFKSTEFIALGSLRRHTATVGDIDIAAKDERIEEILNYFVLYPKNIQTISKGDKKASIRINSDIRVDLMVQPKKIFGSLVQHFTGSRQHNILLRKYAKSLGLSVSEYGIKNLKTGKIYTFENEEDVYKFLKLKYVEPEKRFGENEIEKI